MDIISSSRRNFIKKTGVMAAAVPVMPAVSSLGFTTSKKDNPLKIHIFSKHLQFLDFEEMAKQVAAAGFDGVDLTVRKGGHVEPERVVQELPRAVKAIHGAGLKSIIMATNINDAQSVLNQRVLKTAADNGIKLYRMEYYKYLEGKTIPESIVHYQDKLDELADLNNKIGIIGCYQNHAGTRMGSSIWELYAMMMEANSDGIGCQYDIRHATVEGGLNWSKGLELMRPRIKSIVLKDFIWSQNDDGEWYPENVPLGEGMVDWNYYFKLLKSWQIHVPVSLHLEYPLGGAEHGKRDITVDPQMVYDAMRRDLSFAQKMWRQA